VPNGLVSAELLHALIPLKGSSYTTTKIIFEPFSKKHAKNVVRHVYVKVLQNVVRHVYVKVLQNRKALSVFETPKPRPGYDVLYTTLALRGLH